MSAEREAMTEREVQERIAHLEAESEAAAEAGYVSASRSFWEQARELDAPQEPRR